MNLMCNMWMVRCGSKSKAFDYFKNNNIVAIRWSKLGNLNDFENKYELRDKLKNSLHITKYQKLISDSSIIWKFVHEINIGDYVVTSATRDEFYIGQVTSDYIYNINELHEDNHFINQRKVKWLGGFSKNEFNENIKRSLNAQSTVYSLDKIKDDILNVLNNKIIQENKGTTTPKLSFYSSFKSNYSRNKIFFGAPGTGKSYLLNKEKEDLIHNDGYFERVTFYPSYSYSHFVGTY